MLMESDFGQPLNIGSSELVSMNQLVDIVEEIAGLRLERKYNLSAPKGVNGRNSDNTLIEQVLSWQPSVSLRDGMELTCRWIYDQIRTKAVRAQTQVCGSRAASYSDYSLGFSKLKTILGVSGRPNRAWRPFQWRLGETAK